VRTSSRNVALLLFDEVDLLDVAGPLSTLSTAGRQWNFRPFKVHTVARTTGLVETRSQIRVEARFDFDTCPPPEILIVPGGYGARKALGESATVGWVGDVGRRVDFVLSIGAGSLLLAKAGLVDGVEVSLSSEYHPLLGDLAPTARVSTDPLSDAGKVMTAEKSEGAIALSIALIKKVLGDKLAKAVAATIGHADSGAQGLPPEVLAIIASGKSL
jgi:transcriptional regulator GlxA family with amidase domain